MIVLQIQFIIRVRDIPVVGQRRVRTVHSVQNTGDSPGCKRQGYGSDSAENRAGAAGAVHRRGVEPLCICSQSSSRFQRERLSWFFVLFKGIFRTPSIWTLSPGFQRTFWGALDD